MVFGGRRGLVLLGLCRPGPVGWSWNGWSCHDRPASGAGAGGLVVGVWWGGVEVVGMVGRNRLGLVLPVLLDGGGGGVCILWPVLWG